MSNWQSFFNQLSKPINNENLCNSYEICHCTKGVLLYQRNKNRSNSYIPQDECSLNLICYTIQTDIHRARAFENTPIDTKGTEIHSLGKGHTRVFSFDTLLNK
jgi:hypothetical protein